eukprot:TRINITY_DN2260_c0_g2_i2.p4 TRINITY_DN2260_c0_g2~~TRINITY_DN2260_c0_g2_i2.p4  ORF type:complete len:220 (-),score=-38.47 TRINITY_DN2260_c0_g2_i2:348-1007(-)
MYIQQISEFRYFYKQFLNILFAKANYIIKKHQVFRSYFLTQSQVEQTYFLQSYILQGLTIKIQQIITYYQWIHFYIFVQNTLYKDISQFILRVCHLVICFIILIFTKKKIKHSSTKRVFIVNLMPSLNIKLCTFLFSWNFTTNVIYLLTNLPILLQLLNQTKSYFLGFVYLLLSYYFTQNFCFNYKLLEPNQFIIINKKVIQKIGIIDTYRYVIPLSQK